ncbi:hypothetical protein Tco_0707423 [Tanacetum coccineum]|uniref:Uncharacterized protein n=1 Tax=Tanacetum coccineum TaxID=301880 RepID=A0ABQ4YB23_9ASTR
MNGSHELSNESYVLYDRVINPLTAQQELKTRKDRGTRRGRHSTSSSSAFDQPSSSHLNDDDDGNGERTSRASTPSLIRIVNSLTNDVSQVFHSPPNIDPHMEPFYTRQTEIINRQVYIRDEHHGGLMSIGKDLRNLFVTKEIRSSSREAPLTFKMMEFPQPCSCLRALSAALDPITLLMPLLEKGHLTTANPDEIRHKRPLVTNFRRKTSPNENHAQKRLMTKLSEGFFYLLDGYFL